MGTRSGIRVRNFTPASIASRAAFFTSGAGTKIADDHATIGGEEAFIEVVVVSGLAGDVEFKHSQWSPFYLNGFCTRTC